MIDFFQISGAFDWIITLLALGTLVILVLQLLLVILGAGDWDADFNSDGVWDFDMSAILSPIGIIRFLCGSSWYLVLVNMSCRSIMWWDFIIAIIIGLLCVIAMLFLYRQTAKLANHIEPETNLIGKTGTVYLRFGLDTFEIVTTVNDTSTHITVKSEPDFQFDKLGQIVTITSYKDGIYYIK